MTAEDGAYRSSPFLLAQYRCRSNCQGSRPSRATPSASRANFPRRSTSRWVSRRLGENVAVTGQSPVVDTASTSISTTFDKEKHSLGLPSARDYWAILSEAPGVNSASTSAVTPPARRPTYGRLRHHRSGAPDGPKASIPPKAPMHSAITSTTARSEEVSIGSGASSAESRCPVSSRSSSRSRVAPYHGFVLRRPRVREKLPVVQHRRGADQGRCDRRRWPQSAGHQPHVEPQRQER